MARRWSRLLFIAGPIIGLAGLFAAPAAEIEEAGQSVPKIIDFNRDVRPILSNHCWPCHGTDAAAVARTGGLRLDSFAEATKDRDGFSAIVPGDFKASLISERIHPAQPAYRMPPPDATIDPLNDYQKKILEAWINQGAKYETHWAFVKPKFVPPPADPSGWARNEIDQYIIAKLHEQGLEPEPEASKEALIRRVTFTLTGLPPTIEEIDAFLADTSPDAYEKVVDRLLASQDYGEHQARYWLDAVRYADTHGLHIDNYREIYPYRDWVVRAFNKDLPYDEFTIEQLAGDQLPNPTVQQLIATGYVRMNPTTNEGGAIVEEFQAKNTFDRTDTTATVFMGLTLACARCHDHKYDPLSHEDYYRFFAFFNNTVDEALDGNLNLHQPVMKAPNPKQEKERTILQESILSMLTQTSYIDSKAWLLQQPEKKLLISGWQISPVFRAASFEEAHQKDFLLDQQVKWSHIDIKEGQSLAVGENVANSATYLRSKLQSPRDQKLTFNFGSDDGIQIWLNGKLIHNNQVLRGLTLDQDKIELSLKQGENDLLVKISNGGSGAAFSYSIGDMRTKTIRAAYQLSLVNSGIDTIKDTYLRYGSDSKASTQYQADVAKLEALKAAIPYTYIAQEREERRPTHILIRGEYDQPGKLVKPGTPDIVLPAEKEMTNRLGLARWLTNEDNPLFARVFVNRVWQQHFGVGITRTSEDFGSQGEFPTNLQLLDYLAISFANNGYSTKALNKQIVMSAAFRQESKISATKRAVDPDNRLISRGPRFRFDAEVIRDTALSVSGLLSPKSSGKGVNSYQPPGLWEAVSYPISDTAKYVRGNGDDLYTRSLYIFWKRTSPPATMSIFDAPTREACTVRRSTTNTPMQALASMNSTQFVEAARALAIRMMQAKSSKIDRLVYGFRLVTGRHPSPEELTILSNYLDTQLQNYGANLPAAEKLLAVGEYRIPDSAQQQEAAAWAMVGSLLLNLDETITQH